ncbi:MAG: ABC transporter ATP-binding protein [Dehalococcoidia bacterium]
MARAILEIRDLSASYDSQGTRIPAVRQVDLDLHEGETLALVGESAAGKSSVALSVLGLLPDNATVEGGSIAYDGRSILGLDRAELQRIRGAEISMIFQDAQAALTPTITVGEQMAEIYRAHRGASKREAQSMALERLRETLPDAERVAKAFPFQLSGGMAQRVMIAMATALQPRIIIADEPTASLDAAVRMETLSALERLRDDRGVAVLLITHDFGVVARLADRVAVMYAGEIVEQADVRTIFRRPEHPYTFGLLSSLPAFAPEGGRLEPMRGQPPDLATLPPQCPFLPRCRKAISECRIEDAPRLRESGEGHTVACFNPMAVPLRGE